MLKVLKPTLWYKAKLDEYPNLSLYTDEHEAFQEFMEFLEEKGMYISLMDSRKNTTYFSIYNSTSTERKYWICDIRLFDESGFVEDVEIICKEKMNISGKLYENEKFAKVLGVITGRSIELGSYATIKEKLDFNSFFTALKEVEKAMEIYRIFR